MGEFASLYSQHAIVQRTDHGQGQTSPIIKDSTHEKERTAKHSASAYDGRTGC